MLAEHAAGVDRIRCRREQTANDVSQPAAPFATAVNRTGRLDLGDSGLTKTGSLTTLEAPASVDCHGIWDTMKKNLLVAALLSTVAVASFAQPPVDKRDKAVNKTPKHEKVMKDAPKNENP